MEYPTIFRSLSVSSSVYSHRLPMHDGGGELRCRGEPLTLLPTVLPQMLFDLLRDEKRSEYFSLVYWATFMSPSEIF